MAQTKEEYNSYMREYMLRRYYERQAWAVERLGGKCVKCGSADNLEFDHIDRETKSFTIGSLWSISREKFEAEIVKCQLLCEAHHKDKTRKELSEVRIPNPKHGTSLKYARDGCRCGECREWKRRSRTRTSNSIGLE